MKTESGMINHDFTVDEDLKFLGLVNGSVIVSPGVNFEMAGLIINDLIVNKDAKVFFTGQINGKIENMGGDVKVLGSTGI